MAIIIGCDYCILRCVGLIFVVKKRFPIENVRKFCFLLSDIRGLV